MSLDKLYHQVEKRIMTALVEAALAKGYSIVIDNGEEEHPASTDRQTILNNMAHTDEEWMRIYAADGKAVGTIFTVYGEGNTCITDYSDCPEIEVLVKATENIT